MFSEKCLINDKWKLILLGLALHALLCSTQKFVNNCVDKAMSTAEQSKGLEQGKLPRSAPFSISCFAQDETFKLQ